MSESASSKSAAKTAILTIHGEEGLSNTLEKALAVDDHEPVSGVAITTDRYMTAWRQVLNDDRNTEGHYEIIQEFCSTAADGSHATPGIAQ